MIDIPELRAKVEEHWQTSFGKLREDDFSGWEDYQWGCLYQIRPPRAAGLAKQWSGEEIEGKTLLIHSEQGFGDNIQMLRWLQAAKLQSKATIRLELPTELRRLAACSDGWDTIVEYPKGTQEPFDYIVSLMSLPLAMKLTSPLDKAVIPYIDLPKAKSVKSKKLRVGLVWAGNPGFMHDKTRSLSFNDMRPLLDTPNCIFRSLQIGEASLQSSGSGLRSAVKDYQTFFDTAKILRDKIDLVICCDTAIAHLAGAMGKPFWLLNRYDGAYTWGSKGETSSWYPTARVFRQSKPKQWKTVIELVKAELGALSATV